MPNERMTARASITRNSYGDLVVAASLPLTAEECRLFDDPATLAYFERELQRAMEAAYKSLLTNA